MHVITKISSTTKKTAKPDQARVSISFSKKFTAKGDKEESVTWLKQVEKNTNEILSLFSSDIDMDKTSINHNSYETTESYKAPKSKGTFVVLVKNYHVHIFVTNVEKVEEIHSAFALLDDVSCDAPRFSFSKPEQFEKELLELAIKQARERWRSEAQIMGVDHESFQIVGWQNRFQYQEISEAPAHRAMMASLSAMPSPSESNDPVKFKPKDCEFYLTLDVSFGKM